jgi:hypothetical protein
MSKLRSLSFSFLAVAVFRKFVTYYYIDFLKKSRKCPFIYIVRWFESLQALGVFKKVSTVKTQQKILKHSGNTNTI